MDLVYTLVRTTSMIASSADPVSVLTLLLTLNLLTLKRSVSKHLLAFGQVIGHDTPRPSTIFW
jgi:hypothetical protein